MTTKKYGARILALAVGGIFSFGAEAAIIPIDLNDFFTFDDPDVSISVDGTSAHFEEYEFATFLRLSNDPFVGDPNVILPAADTSLTFDYEFSEAVSGDDSFSAFLFDADIGIVGGILETFEVFDTAVGSFSFDLSSHVGLSLGLEFELEDSDPFGGVLGTTATLRNLSLTTATVSEPPTFLLFLGGIAMFSVIGKKGKNRAGRLVSQKQT
jgi:hypothetical protein